LLGGRGHPAVFQGFARGAQGEREAYQALLGAVVEVAFDLVPRGVGRLHDPRPRGAELLLLMPPSCYVDAGKEDARTTFRVRYPAFDPRHDRIRAVGSPKGGLVLDPVVLVQEPSLDVRRLAGRDERLVEELAARAFVVDETRQGLEGVVVAHDAKVLVEHTEEGGRTVDDGPDELTFALELVDATAKLPLEPLLLDGRFFLSGPRRHAPLLPTVSYADREV
jgi:hypothetical protein